MPSSLKRKIKQLYKQGKINEVEYNTLINKVDARSERIHKLLKENKPVEAKWKLVIKDGDEFHLFCTNCWWHIDYGAMFVNFTICSDYCPRCGAKITGRERECRYTISNIVAGSLDNLKEEMNEQHNNGSGDSEEG